MIRAPEYIEFLRSEYLADYIRAGGAAVKFVVPQNDASAPALSSGLREAAEQGGYAYARVDAKDVKVHMIDKVFHAIARQIPWDDLARSVVRNALSELRFRLPADGAEPSLEAIARENGYDPFELRRDFNRRLQEDLFRDYQMAQEFRIAMIRLCQAQVDRGAPAEAERAAVIEWLTGELRRISALKQALIFQKIARHNARHMLFSLARWLTKAGRSGLVLELDIRRCTGARHSGEEGWLNYSKAAALDAYEVLRQLIDATDEMTSCLTVVTCAPEFLNDQARGVQAYLALKLRIWDDVRDAQRSNPHAALLRLSPEAQPLMVLR